MPDLADFQSGVDARIQDTVPYLSAEARLACIKEALRGRYSQVRPRKLIKDIAGDSATKKFALTVAGGFVDWDEGFSAVKVIEYPQGEIPAEYLESDDWYIYQAAANRELHLVSAPATGKTARVVYTVLHKDDGSTVPTGEFEGVVNLAASIAARRLQATYSQMGPSGVTPTADVETKRRGYERLADDLEKAFETAFGLNEQESAAPASVTADWETSLADGLGKLTH